MIVASNGTLRCGALTLNERKTALTKRLLSIAAIALILSACSSTTDQPAANNQAIGSTASAAAPQASTAPASAAPTAPALSQNERVVKTFVDALDALGIEHSEPKRTEAGALSKASYDITINGNDSGIQIFADEESQKSWVKASDSLGGVCVVIDGAALSLNSSKGIEDSAKIAPKIAEKVAGEAHGV